MGHVFTETRPLSQSLLIVPYRAEEPKCVCTVRHAANTQLLLNLAHWWRALALFKVESYVLVYATCIHQLQSPKNGVSTRDWHTYKRGPMKVYCSLTPFLVVKVLHSVSVRRLINSPSRTVLRMYPIVEWHMTICITLNVSLMSWW